MGIVRLGSSVSFCGLLILVHLLSCSSSPLLLGASGGKSGELMSHGSRVAMGLGNEQGMVKNVRRNIMEDATSKCNPNDTNANNPNRVYLCDAICVCRWKDTKGIITVEILECSPSLPKQLSTCYGALDPVYFGNATINLKTVYLFNITSVGNFLTQFPELQKLTIKYDINGMIKAGEFEGLVNLKWLSISSELFSSKERGPMASLNLGNLTDVFEELPQAYDVDFRGINTSSLNFEKVFPRLRTLTVSGRAMTDGYFCQNTLPLLESLVWRDLNTGQVDLSNCLDNKKPRLNTLGLDSMVASGNISGLNVTRLTLTDVDFESQLLANILSQAYLTSISISSMTMSGQNITKMPDGFSSLKYMQYVWVRQVPLETLPLPGIESPLKYFSCSWANIGMVDFNSFSAYRDTLTDIYLDSANIRDVVWHTVQLADIDFATVDCSLFSGSLYKVDTLEVSNNKLESIPFYLGCIMPNLTSLRAPNNRLIEAHFGVQLNLTDLDLANNFISSIKCNGNVLERDLRTNLNINNNRLVHFGDCNLGRTTNFGSLLLNNNRLKSLNNSFDGATIINGIDLSGNQFVDLKNVLSKFAEVGYVNLANNNISSIDFSALPMNVSSSVQSLNFSGNILESCYNISLNKYMSQLETIDLSHNQLTELPSNCFWQGNNIPDLQGFEHFYVEYNKISKIHPRALRNLESLKSVYLRNNSIETIPEPFMLNCGNTLGVEVDLRFNSIGSVDLAASFQRTIVSKIDLSHNKLTEIPFFNSSLIGMFTNASTTSLSPFALVLSHNQITSENASFCPPGIDANSLQFQLVQALVLSDNLLTRVPLKLQECQGYGWLDVSSNDIEFIEDSSNGSPLSFLYLEETGLTALPYDFYERFGLIEKLRLSPNIICYKLGLQNLRAFANTTSVSASVGHGLYTLYNPDFKKPLSRTSFFNLFNELNYDQELNTCNLTEVNGGAGAIVSFVEANEFYENNDYTTVCEYDPALSNNQIVLDCAANGTGLCIPGNEKKGSYAHCVCTDGYIGDGFVCVLNEQEHIYFYAPDFLALYVTLLAAFVAYFSILFFVILFAKFLVPRKGKESILWNGSPIFGMNAFCEEGVVQFESEECEFSAYNAPFQSDYIDGSQVTTTHTLNALKEIDEDGEHEYDQPVDYGDFYDDDEYMDRETGYCHFGRPRASDPTIHSLQLKDENSYMEPIEENTTTTYALDSHSNAEQPYMEPYDVVGVEHANREREGGTG
eukprot:Nk52_evm14s261 gene=Nk52_evmTU14s261